MQNMDLYTGRNARSAPSFPAHDPEYFTRMAAANHRDEERNKKKASRMFSFILALCIISFTTGLVVGIKFTAGANKQLVDDRTAHKVGEIGTKVKGMIATAPKTTTPDDAAAAKKKQLFPKSEFPFVILVGRGLEKRRADEIASFLSTKGHTVIVSKSGGAYTLYTGPYRDRSDASAAQQNLGEYGKPDWFSRAEVLSR